MTTVWFVSKQSGSVVKPWKSLSSSKAPGVTGPRRFSYGGGPLLLHHGSRHATGLHGGAVHQENVGWSWGFGIPAIGMLISTVLFLVRYSIYVLLKPGSSLFTRIAQVVAAAFRKRQEEARRKSRGI